MERLKPVELKPARAWRTYLGGAQIERMHGNQYPEDSHFPEEWIMSVVTARNPGREEILDEGLSYIKNEENEETNEENGETKEAVTLRQLICEAPELMLGKKHTEQYGSSMGVLVKIIDSSERLTIQVHPDKAAAKALFGSEFGKTECWHILGTRKNMAEKACIYLGFKEGVTRRQWMELFERQDIPAMLECLHRFEVKAGDTFIIHGGVPHAIGAGCMLIEIQEPTDYTIRTELVTPAGLRIAEEQCHQGLGFERMFDCFHYCGCSESEARARWQIPERRISSEPDGTENGSALTVGGERRGSLTVGEERRSSLTGEEERRSALTVGGERRGSLSGGTENRISLVDDRETACFRLEKYEISGTCRIENRDVFSGIYVIDGEGELSSGDSRWAVKPGSQFFLPADCTPVEIKKVGEQPVCVFRFYGPKLGD